MTLTLDLQNTLQKHSIRCVKRQQQINCVNKTGLLVQYHCIVRMMLDVLFVLTANQIKTKPYLSVAAVQWWIVDVILSCLYGLLVGIRSYLAAATVHTEQHCCVLLLFLFISVMARCEGEANNSAPVPRPK